MYNQINSVRRKTIMSEWQDAIFELDDIVRLIKLETQTFYEKGNKSAGTRARKHMSDLQKWCQAQRKAVQDKKNNPDPTVQKETKVADDNKKKTIELRNDENEFELMLRFFGNEILAIKLAATNFNGKLIMWSIVIMLFTFMLMEVFGFSAMLGVDSGM